MPVLGIGRCSAYELVRSGQLRCLRIGHQIRILKQDLEQYLFRSDQRDDVENIS